MTAALAALALMAVPAYATWSPPEVMSQAGSNVVSQQSSPPVGLAVNPANGDSVITWLHDVGISTPMEVRTRTAAGDLSRIQRVAPDVSYGYGVEAAMADNGDAVLVWTRSIGGFNRVQARRLSGGVLGPTITLSASGLDAQLANVAIDAAGNALVVWSADLGGNFRIQARSISAGGALGSTQTLSAAGRNAFGPDVAMDSGGNAIVVWGRLDDNLDVRAQAVVRSPGGTYGAAQNLSSSGMDASSTHVAMGSNGDAIVTWDSADFSGDGEFRVAGRVRPHGGSFAPAQFYSAAGTTAQGARAGVDSFGNAMIVWEFQTSPRRVQVRGRASNGTLGATQTMSSTTTSADNAEIAVSPSGNAVITWQQADGTGSDANQRLYARYREIGGQLATARTVSPAREDVINPFRVVMGPNEHALATWIQNTGEYFQLDLSAGP